MLPVIQNPNSSLPVVEGQEQFAVDMFNNAFSGFFSTFRFLRPKKLDFQISSGGSTQSIPNGEVVGVLLGVAPFNHCTWYEKKFQPGQEPELPDLLWVQRDPNKFPDALPEQYRHKVNVGGVERWDFRIARRTVWALLQRTVSGQVMLDIDNPVIFDMTSASMFGKSDPRSNSYKWTGLKQFCDQFSTMAVKCNPLMFYTQIAIDPNSTVQGVVVFRPQMGERGPVFLDNETYAAIIEKAKSQSVTEMLTVQEILERRNQAKTVAPAPQPAAPTAPLFTAQPAPQVTQPMPDDNPGETADLLRQAQNVMDKAAQEQQPAAQPQHRPQVSAAAADGIANIMGSLGDF